MWQLLILPCWGHHNCYFVRQCWLFSPQRARLVISPSQSWQFYSVLPLIGLRVDMTQFWLIGYKESFLEHIFSYVKKKQSLREGSRLPFSNANGVCDASTSVDILTSWWCAQWQKYSSLMMVGQTATQFGSATSQQQLWSCCTELELHVSLVSQLLKNPPAMKET